MTPLEYVIYAFASCMVIFIVPGQLFFILIYEGTKGFKRGLKVLLGVLASETLLLYVLFAGVSDLLSAHLYLLKIAGAALLTWFGASAMWSALKPHLIGRRDPYSRGPLALGFLFTFLNPPFIIWFLTVGVSVLNVGVVSVGAIAHLVFALALFTSTAAVSLMILVLTATGRKTIGERGLRFLSAISGVVFLVLVVNVVLT